MLHDTYGFKALCGLKSAESTEARIQTPCFATELSREPCIDDSTTVDISNHHYQIYLIALEERGKGKVNGGRCMIEYNRTKNGRG